MLDRAVEKILLQLAVGVAGLVPVSAGLAGALLGPAFVAAAVPGAIDLDSHLRYLSGLLLAIGIGFWSTVPAIERKGRRFRLLTALVVCGGLARLVSLLMVGVPGPYMLGGLVMELVVTPSLAAWQARIGARFAPRP